LYVLSNEIDTRIYDPGTLIVGTSNRNSRNALSVVETLNYAAFAEANANATDHLTFTAGLRWTHEDVDSRVTGFPIAPGYIRFGHPLGTTVGSATASKVSWKLGGQWRTDADKMFYASVATGFKGPGFNVNNGVLGDPEAVAPETSTSYELGMKTQYFERRLTLNLNLFHTVFENFQTQGGFVEPGNPTARIILLNADELRTRGVEAELSAAPLDALSITANVSYADATFERFANAPCYPRQPVEPNECVGSVQDLSGSRLPNAPRWNANLFGEYQFAIPSTRWDGFVNLNYSWRDSIQWNALGSPAGIEPGYSLLGAAIGFRSNDDHLAVKFYGKNLTDKFHTSGIVVGQQIHHFLPPDYRRIFGVDIALKY
jgi:iron complex outermembrane receptor protein